MGVAAAEAEVLFAGDGTLAAFAGAVVFAGVFAVFGDFSDFAFGDGVTVFALAFAGDALALPFEAVATAGSA